MTLYSIDYKYQGEVDNEGKACGFGIAREIIDPKFAGDPNDWDYFEGNSYEGTWLDNKPHGVGE